MDTWRSHVTVRSCSDGCTDLLQGTDLHQGTALRHRGTRVPRCVVLTSVMVLACITVLKYTVGQSGRGVDGGTLPGTVEATFMM
eukprot:795750-Rhodomonas_salina.1